MNNFTIARKIILDKRRPFTGRRASDAGGRFFQCLLRGLPAVCLSRAYSCPGKAGGLSSETRTRGCVVESKRAFSVSFERSGIGYSIPKRCITQREEPRLQESVSKRCRRQRIQCLLRGLPAVWPFQGLLMPRQSRGPDCVF